MPVTLPAHAAAVLPFCRERFRWMPPVALVVGSTAPDLVYLIGTYGAASHLPLGLLTHCLPLGLAAYLAAELLWLPLLRERLPATAARWAVTRGVPTTPVGWLGLVAALLLGAATHQLWDGFTHVGWWPERLLYPHAKLTLLGTTLFVARWLWVASSVFGSLIALAWFARRARTLSLPTGQPRRTWPPLAVAVATGVLFGIAWRIRFPFGGESGYQDLWNYFWAATRYSMVAVTALAVVDAFRRWKAPRT